MINPAVFSRFLFSVFVWGTFVIAASSAYHAFAQQEQPPSLLEGAPGSPAMEPAVTEEVPVAASDAAAGEMALVEMPSVLFTYWEHIAIRDARRSRGLVRPPSEDELARDLLSKPDRTPGIKPPPEERDISLGGIVYVSNKDWTIWLNGQRVKPDAVPEEVMDLRVYKGYVEMKWFDYYTNQIFPVRLRPHQRFNIDTRIFLPG